jgi:formylglycine-generating enzyme required for sulfatase activity
LVTLRQLRYSTLMRHNTWLATLLYLVLQPLSGCYKGCPEDRHEFCARNGGRDCGDVTATNACGEVQTINCGQCYGPDICGGKGVPNVCAGCTHPQVNKDCADGWCTISAGCFQMGAHTDDPCDEVIFKNPPPFTVFGKEPHHAVALTHRFELMDAQVTQEDFKALMGYNPAKNINVPQPQPQRMPVEYVSWHEAAIYANALSTKKGYPPCYSCTGSQRFASCETASDYAGAKIYSCPGYRLATEAEWEYAFRAGTNWPLYNMTEPLTDCPTEPKLNEIAWNGADQPDGKAYHHSVKTKVPNAWGLYDMAGNGFEWCHDWGVKEPGADKISNPWGAASGAHRVIRSCSYDWEQAMFFRASTRRLEDPKHVCASVGMRLARSLGESNK